MGGSSPRRAHWVRRVGTPRSGFHYVTEDGRRVTAPRVLDRIAALRVPPAYQDVHIAVDPRASVQAWGFDSRGRKQYRYHPRAVERGQLRKYHRVARLARDLPAIRAAVARDFARRGFGKRKVAAGVARLIDEGHLRVGSDRYTRLNHTYGSTTLHKRHARSEDGTIVLEYAGKRGIRQRHVILDPSLCAFIRALKRTPGHRLFRYREGGDWHDLTAGDLNRYLRDLLGVPYTAKDFRTWGGTLQAAMVLADLGSPQSARDAKRNVATAIRIVAASLGNTPAICRKSYVHPIVTALYTDRGLTIADARSRHPRQGGRQRPPSGEARRSDPWVLATPEERALVAFLAEHFPDRRRKPREETARRARGSTDAAA